MLAVLLLIPQADDRSGASGAVTTETFAAHGTEPLIERLRRATIGRYDIYAELGSGGMASVFLALDLALDRKVAIKVMSPALASSEDAIERFRREARVAAALSHPNIIGIYAVGDDPELAFYVMKFVEGRSLDSVIRDEGRQSITFTQAIIQYAGNALAYAHTRGVVHRDVKPANFMLDLDGWLVVTDFGIAKMEDAKGLTMSGTLVGTPYYMSPEQFDGSPITGASDQYALGIVAFEMLTGQTPFNATSLGEVMKGHLLDPPPPIRQLRPDVPPEMEACIERMLAKKPEQRFPSLTDAVTAFGSIHPADERVVRTQIITLAKSGALLQPRMSVPASPMPTRNPARPPRSGGSRATPASPPPAAKSRGRAVGLLLTVVLGLGGLYVARPEVFMRFGLAPGGAPGLERAPVSAGPPVEPDAPATPAPATVAADSAPSVAVVPESTPPVAPREAPPIVPRPRPAARQPVRETASTERSEASSTGVSATPDAPAQQPAVQQPAAQRPAVQQPPVEVAAPEQQPDAPASTEPGIIVIQSNIEGVLLYIDGVMQRVIGGQGRQRISLPPGERRIRLHAEGCTPWDTVVQVQAQTTANIGNRFPRC
jgi:eukaryotic-like serine/threonine-protein kinase